jgi:hypothetical protein
MTDARRSPSGPKPLEKEPQPKHTSNAVDLSLAKAGLQTKPTSSGTTRRSERQQEKAARPKKQNAHARATYATTAAQRRAVTTEFKGDPQHKRNHARDLMNKAPRGTVATKAARSEPLLTRRQRNWTRRIAWASPRARRRRRERARTTRTKKKRETKRKMRKKNKRGARRERRRKKRRTRLQRKTQSGCAVEIRTKPQSRQSPKAPKAQLAAHAADRPPREQTEAELQGRAGPRELPDTNSREQEKEEHHHETADEAKRKEAESTTDRGQKDA